MEIIPTQKIINRDGVRAVKNGQKGNQYSHIPNLKKPEWLKVKAQFNPNFHKIKNQETSRRHVALLRFFHSANAVCLASRCPQIFVSRFSIE